MIVVEVQYSPLGFPRDNSYTTLISCKHALGWEPFCSFVFARYASNKWAMRVNQTSQIV